MARCEDAPCCGHEPGCCPDFDPETGKQLNMKCTCGATVPLTSRSSLCEGCLHPGRRRSASVECDCDPNEDHEDECENHPDNEDRDEDDFDHDTVDHGDPLHDFENCDYD